MIELIQQGGVVMWPIAFFAFITVVVLMDRALFFKLTNVRYSKFKDHLLDKIDAQHLHELEFSKKYTGDAGGEKQSSLKKILGKISILQWNSSPYTKIAHGYAVNIEKGERSRDEALKRIGSEEIEKMEKHFKILSSISVVAPLMGLLGTVMGIIQSFQTIQQMGGQVDVNALAGGIWVAMITTAAGLIVAIPAQLGYLYFDKLVTERSNRMSYIITYLNEKFFEEKNSTINPICNYEDVIDERSA